MGTRRLIVVCSEPTLRRAIVRVLTARRPNLRVVAVESLDGLRAELERSDVDAVLCDVADASAAERAPLLWLAAHRPELHRVAYASPAISAGLDLGGAVLLRCPSSIDDMLAAIDPPSASSVPPSTVRRRLAAGTFEPVRPLRRLLRRPPSVDAA